MNPLHDTWSNNYLLHTSRHCGLQVQKYRPRKTVSRVRFDIKYILKLKKAAVVLKYTTSIQMHEFLFYIPGVSRG